VHYIIIDHVLMFTFHVVGYSGHRLYTTFMEQLDGTLTRRLPLLQFLLAYSVSNPRSKRKSFAPAPGADPIIPSLRPLLPRTDPALIRSPRTLPNALTEAEIQYWEFQVGVGIGW
jgi:hypothetical protein